MGVDRSWIGREVPFENERFSGNHIDDEPTTWGVCCIYPKPTQTPNILPASALRIGAPLRATPARDYPVATDLSLRTGARGAVSQLLWEGKGRAKPFMDWEW